ncbi:MAG: hypothetical protein J6Z23_06395 [Lachnospiraceae bacterium]|nr:hypothetical protein [Lachnospiraceae bacterium]
MLKTIENALKNAGVSLWRIETTETRTAELYFIRKALDLPRYNEVTSYEVTVFRDFTEDGVRYRGSSSASLSPGMTEEETGRKIAEAYYAAQFVKNPWYELPDAVSEPHRASRSDLSALSVQEIAARAGETVLSADTDGDAFVNSLEVFAARKSVGIRTSYGLSVGYDSDRLSGEFVVQCVTPQDVEQYRSFSYDSLDLPALYSKVRDAIRDVRLRAAASETPESGTYDLLLTGDNVKELFSYYDARSSASIIYAGYSTWKPGDAVQGEVTDGEPLKITFIAGDPYSPEGIPMKDRVLMEDGKLVSVTGSARFCRYLGVEPTGSYRKIRVDAGTVPLADLRKEGVLEATCFSDFQMDFFDGHFAGEMRLSTLIRDGKAVPMTGGSVNGSILESQGRLVFSKERYKTDTYDGPYAVLVRGVRVAGVS